MSSRTYKDFPDSYFTIIDHFRASPEPFPVSRGDERSRAAFKRSFYRFREALGIATENGDDFAKSLHRLAKNITLSIQTDKIIFSLDILFQFEKDMGDSFILPPEDESTPTKFDAAEIEELIKSRKNPPST